MTSMPLLYVASVHANLTEPDAVLGVALVSTGGVWRYIETVDVDETRLDDFARERVVPRMKKLPFGKFVRSIDLVSSLGQAAASIGWTAAQPLRTLAPMDDRLGILLHQALGDRVVNAGPNIAEVQADRNLFDEFIERSGGDRVRHHPLVRAIGTALCDRSRGVPTNFQSMSVHQFELLMGSKNALSFRAWVRTQERQWIAEQASAVLSVDGS